MRWVWKIWVDHNKTDYDSIGSISEITNKLYKIVYILHTEKVFHLQIYCIFHTFWWSNCTKMAQIHFCILARLHGNQILIPKFWHLLSSFCIKGHIWCKFHQNLRHAVSKLLWCLGRVDLKTSAAFDLILQELCLYEMLGCNGTCIDEIIL